MKMMTLVSVTSSWLCATGVAIISSYCILTHNNGTAADQKKAAQVASSISKRGTVPEYKPTKRHSSAVKKTTTAKVVKEIKIPKFVPNPIYAPFTNALNRLAEDVADLAKDGNVELENGFVLCHIQQHLRDADHRLSSRVSTRFQNRLFDAEKDPASQRRNVINTHQVPE